MARRRRGRAVSGWVVLDKPEGMTSTRAVGAVRRLFDAAKAGHAGTLDPLASGLLPIALGEATKLAGRLMDSPKCYAFTVRWGEARDTDDAEGEIVATSDRRPKRADIRALLPDFLGDIEQRPPVYSAIKVQGERAYDLARSGRPVELRPRRVRIDRFELLEHDGGDCDHASFEVDCGKGAYIRGLARDLGARLGCFGHVVKLRRARVGPFDQSDAIFLDKLEDLRHKGALDETLFPIEAALDDIPALVVTETEAARLRNGQAVRVPSTKAGTVCVMADGRPVALAEVEGGEVRPVRVFNL